MKLKMKLMLYDERDMPYEDLKTLHQRGAYHNDDFLYFLQKKILDYNNAHMPRLTYKITYNKLMPILN